MFVFTEQVKVKLFNMMVSIELLQRLFGASLSFN